MFTSLIGRLPALPTLQTLGLKSGRAKSEDDYVLVDVDAHGQSTSVVLPNALQPPAPQAVPAAERVNFWCYETEVKSINQQIAHASYGSMKYLLDNKPAFYTPEVLHTGSATRFGKLLEEAKHKAMMGLQRAAASANTLLDNMVSFDSRRDRHSVALEIETELATQWQESVEGNVTERFVAAVHDDPKHALVNLRWSGKLVIENGRFVPELQASAEQQLPVLGALYP